MNEPAVDNQRFIHHIYSSSDRMTNTADTIQADARTVSNILDKTKYEIDVFQREYQWGRKQIDQLITDLESKFSENYDKSHPRHMVQSYSRYYLGSIITNLKDSGKSIIDGQQRLTSLTLLLIYLNNLQKSREDKVLINDLIFSEKYSVKSYNLQIPERVECMDALYIGKDYDPTSSSKSVKNLIERYQDIQELFPEDLKNEALPYFIDWLIYNVILVEIKTNSDDDAYTIFETMNDRGLNLTSTEMLKGYLLSKLGSDEQKIQMNDLWKNRIDNLKEIHKEEDLEFFKSWFRAKYAESIRPGKKGAENEDFEKIGTRFHSWVRDNLNKLSLNNCDSFYDFIKNDFEFFSRMHLKIYNATQSLNKKLKHVYYLDWAGFAPSFYYPLITAPIKSDDLEEIVEKKMEIMAQFLETYLVFRLVNRRTMSYNSIRYSMFSLIKEVRDMTVEELANHLKEKVKMLDENLSGLKDFVLHQQNKRFVKFLLARITKHIEEKCGIESNFDTYLDPEIKAPYEIEHIWADKFEEHTDEFQQRDEFDEWRNRMGDLILLPKGFNQSYGDHPYESKLPHYFGQNLLARTLSPQCYQNNPSFVRYVSESGIPFKDHTQFKKKDIKERQNLYQKICEEIWNLDGFDEIVNR
ncbi:MAG: DUF262 domain-containing protein [Nitrosopumilus sp.]|uniref:DUF262 domain-containing protein n=1 Tax=Nitrosopumilus sp. TaxID=2024843 RepID=UPI00242A3BD3|nr:DUF262 domain-containing protein [Nitrosopumilus sp.]MCV0366324.1 DUF262 domain-containing protein [Nitrosopumilus sp.]